MLIESCIIAANQVPVFRLKTNYVGKRRSRVRKLGKHTDPFQYICDNPNGSSFAAKLFGDIRFRLLKV